MSEQLRVAIVADIHNGPDHQTKKGTCALELLEQFVGHVSDTRPDYVVDLGDRITDLDHDRDRHHLREVTRRFSAIKTPRVHLIGNHDQRHLSRAENAEMLGLPVEHGSCRVNGWRLISWQAGVAFDPDIAFHRVPEEDVDWLVSALAADKTPAIVFSHVPVSGQSMIGNSYFENNPLLASYPNHRYVCRAIEPVDVEVIWIAGHVHWNTITTIRGIRHLTVQSLTECNNTYPHAAGAYAELAIDAETIGLVVHGRDPFELRMQRLKGTQRSWTEPFPAMGTDADPSGFGDGHGGSRRPRLKLSPVPLREMPANGRRARGSD